VIHDSDSIKHFCGVAGVFCENDDDIPAQLFYSLFALQHRGQESCGIAYRRDGKTIVYKDLGMVSQVLSHYLEKPRSSKVGIGHVRYSTNGGNKLENAQPIVVECNKGTIALAHNGNISNTTALKQHLFADGSIFQTSSDSELILHLISRSRAGDFHSALVETLQRVEGAYSITMIHDNRLIVIRDPLGFRPLYLGWKDGMYAAVSETCALDILGISEYRAVEPGEIISISADGINSEFLPRRTPQAQCVFELIYFARPDSDVFDHSVHAARKRMGKALAAGDNAVGDVVLPVPDSGNSAALGYAEASGVPFELGLTRNHYAGRSFILPTKSARELAVRMKLHPVKHVIEGRSVILVDDSLVRGTTARSLVRLVREAGAREVHLRLCSPEIRWPCFFGIDIPTRGELISNHLSNAQIAEYIDADSVRFLSIESLRGCLENHKDFCYACFSGNYPIKVPLGPDSDLPPAADLPHTQDPGPVGRTIRGDAP